MSAILANIFIFFLGLAFLILGSNYLVKYSLVFSYLFRLSSLLVGIIIVAFGTSLPEAAVSIVSSLKGESGIALGNVIGSNIANIGLVLGLSGLIRPLKVEKELFQKEIPAMILASLLLFLFSLDLYLSRAEGFVFLGLFFLFLFFSLQGKKKPLPENKALSKILACFFLLISLAGVILGAELMVKGGVAVAEFFGISSWAVGISIFAVGTSLPELAASAAAAFKKEADLSLGNVIGSNIFNIFLVLGIALVIRPIKLGASILKFDLPFLLLMSFLFLLFTRTRFKLQRWEAGVLVLAYGLFLVFIIRF